MILPLVATVAIVLSSWHAVLSIARWRKSPRLYRWSEVVAGAVGLIGIYAWLPLAKGLAFWGMVQKPLLWSLHWTLVGIVTGLLFAIGAKVVLEREGVIEPVDGVLEDRRIDIYD